MHGIVCAMGVNAAAADAYFGAMTLFAYNVKLKRNLVLLVFSALPFF